MKYAQESRLDFLITHDHNSLEPMHQKLDGFHGNCLVVAQMELNDPDDRNHYLTLDVNQDIPPNLPAADNVRLVREQGGFGIIAHPHEHRHELKYPAYPWDCWNEKFDGMELWNQLSSWKEALSRWNRPWRFIKPNMTLTLPPQETLDKWDEVNLERDVIGVFGIDAHALKYRTLMGLCTVTIFPYKVHFKSLRVTALVPSPLKNYPVEEARRILIDAFRAGRLHCINHRLGDGIGFRFWAEHGQHDVLWPGASVKFEPGWTLLTKSPDRCKLRLIRNGVVDRELYGHELSLPIEEPGVYRIEAHKKERGWLYTNPIRFRKPK